MEVKEAENRKYAAAKRLAMRRRKKIRTAVLLISAFVLVAVVLIILSYTVLFPISNITVNGNTLYGADKITEISGVEPGDKLFAVSEKQVRENLTVKLPYIKSVKIKRVLFSAIEITVSETSDAYCYCLNGKYFTADTDNKALAVFDSKPQGITEVTVAELSEINLGYIIDIGEENLKTVNEIYKILTDVNMKIDSLDISNASAVNATVEGRFSVNFGTMQDIDRKTEHLRAMIENINLKNGSTATGKINLSVWSTEKREGYFEQTENF